MAIFLAVISLAAGPAEARRHPFRTFSEQGGLPMSAVNGVVQAQDGTLWLVGRGGAAVFDGFAWRREDEGDGVGTVPLGRIATDGGGNLWAVARHTPVQLFRREAGQWQALPPCPASAWGRAVSAFAVDGSRAQDPVIAVATSQAGVRIWRRGAWRELALPGGARVHHLRWQDGTLGAATAQGLYTIAVPEEGPLRAVPVAGLPAGPVYATVGTGADLGQIVAGRGWLGRLGAGGYTPIATDPRLDLPDAFAGVAAVRDSLGGIWCSTPSLVVHHHPLSGLEFLDRSSGLVANGAADLTVDREGQVWLVGPRGVSVLGDRRATGWDREAGLLADEVTAVLELADGRILLGHEGGLTVLADEPRPVPITRDGATSRVMGLAAAPDGSLWLAGGALGLARLDEDLRPHWMWRPARRSGSCAAVAVGPDGTVWAGGSDGLVRRVGDAFLPVPLTTPADSTPVLVRRIHAAADGTVHLATGRHGVIVVTPAGAVRRTAVADPEANSTYAVQPAPDGGWWVGTGAGLRRLGPGGIGPIGLADPVIDRPVYAIATDPAGRVWFGTDAGVRAWDGIALRPFGVADGLLGAETNRDAVTVDSQGRLWVGTDRGVTVLDERLGWDGAPPPAARLEAFVVDGLVLPPDRALRLGPDARELVIRLGSSSLAAPGRIRFRTYLEGFDRRWREAETLPDRALRFTNLPVGTYRFHAQAVDADGRPGAVVTSASLQVAPPLWRRPAVLASAAVAILGLVWLAATAVNGRAYARRLRREVAARTAELAASEQAVRRESHRLEVVLGSISDGVIVAGPDGRITLGNAAAARLLGIAPGRLAGRALEEVLPGVTAMVREARAAQLTGTSSFVGDDAAIPYRVGSNGRDLEIAVAPLEDAQGSSGARVLAFRDVTGRRRNEDERMHMRRLGSLGLLAGGIAHDFNNLLTIVLGNTAVARDTAALPAEAAAGLDNIEQAALRARDLTSRLLDFARGDAPRTRPVDLAAGVRRTAGLVLADSALGLVDELPADLRPVAADPGQLDQVLQNVLLNARQAMPRGGTVRVVARNTDGDGANGKAAVELTIADEGPGIAAADLERVFEPYYTTKAGGTGLGLAIAYAIVARHGGRLTVASQPGAGAAFTLRLPAALAVPAAACPDQADPVSGAAS
ncbi:MAG: ATP-binding protein [Candidatus Krumholzibacteriia bacterium]